MVRSGWGSSETSPRRDLLLPHGQLCLVQVVPRRNQRLYDLVEWADADAGLAVRVRDAEEALYADDGDPLVSWDADDLRGALAEAGLAHAQLRIDAQQEPRRFTEGHIQRWFAEEAEGRTTYAARLHAAGLSDDEVLRVSALYRQQLANRVVDWETSLAWIIARAGDA